MKENVSANKNNDLPKSDLKDKPNSLPTEYIIGTLFIAIIYVLVTSSPYDIATFIAILLGSLIPPAIIAGIVTMINKGNYVKNLFWTSLVVMTLSAFGQLSM